MKNSYHNTNGETGDVLLSSESKAQTQEQIILGVYEIFYTATFTADEIHKFINATRPITSTRRAISNLAKDGKLKKTAIQRPGEYGKLTYAYQLNF